MFDAAENRSLIRMRLVSTGLRCIYNTHSKIACQTGEPDFRCYSMQESIRFPSKLQDAWLLITCMASVALGSSTAAWQSPWHRIWHPALQRQSYKQLLSDAISCGVRRPQVRSGVLGIGGKGLAWQWQTVRLAGAQCVVSSPALAIPLPKEATHWGSSAWAKNGFLFLCQQTLRQPLAILGGEKAHSRSVHLLIAYFGLQNSTLHVYDYT